MRPTIRHISTIDGNNPTEFQPHDADNFSVTLRLIIGPTHSAGEESFDITVCSPSNLVKECERDGFVLGRHRLIVCRYDFGLLRRILVKLVENCHGDTWQDVAAKLNRIAYWEFEDYQSP
jgi:Immunity protein 8